MSIRTPSTHLLRLLAVAVLVTSSTSCGGSGPEDGALRRGDQAWVEGDVEEALAEYRLALLEGRADAEVFARIGHAYAELGKIDEAADHYRQAIEADDSYTDQAVSDLVRLAWAAEGKADRFGVASALEATAEFRPGVSVAELALPLARYYAQSGEYGRALPYYRKALAGIDPDGAPDVVFETGLAHEEVGDCDRALLYYEQFADMVPRSQRSEVEWHIGECSYLVATSIRRDLKRAREDGVAPPGGFAVNDSSLAGVEGLPGEDGAVTDAQLEALEELALFHLDRTVTLGEPRSRQAQAYFEMGELLAERGACPEAVEAFRQVTRVDPSGAGILVTRARERIDEIRFGTRPPSTRDGSTPPC